MEGDDPADDVDVDYERHRRWFERLLESLKRPPIQTVNGELYRQIFVGDDQESE